MKRTKERVMKIAAVGLCACVSAGAVLLAGCGGSTAEEVVIWGGAEDQTLLNALVSEFREQNPDVSETIRVEVQDAWDAQSVVSKDPSAAADVILIPHDQVGIMAKAGLLAEIRDGTAATFASDIRSNNDPKTVRQATYDGKLYGFPLTMDTYIEYYTTVIYPSSVEDTVLSSVDKMLAAPMPQIGSGSEKAQAFGFRIEDGFYLNMGFFAVGCTLFGESGEDVQACDWNNENGMKFMRYAAANFRKGGAFKSDDAKNLATAVLNNRLGACISGGWEMQDTFKGAKNIGYRTLPSITIEGKELPLVSFSNSKQYVINNMSQHKATAARLAAFVTNEENQKRYAEERMYYPANLKAQQSEFVKNNAFFAVLRQQLDKSVPVPIIPEISRYWEAAKAVGSSVYNGSLAGDDASLKSALDTFVDTVVNGAL